MSGMIMKEMENSISIIYLQINWGFAHIFNTTHSSKMDLG